MKKLLMLGGTRNMLEVLNEAQNMGISVGVTDWYNESVSPAKRLANEAYNVSISDSQGIDSILQENNYDGIITGFTDSYLKYYSDTCLRNELPCYGTPEQFRILTEKAIYKPLMERFKVPSLPTYQLSDITSGFNNYPIIIKPSDGSGGKGIKIAYDFTEFIGIKEDLNEKSDHTDIVIEPYIEDRQEVTIFFLAANGEIILSGTSNRYLSSKKHTKIGLPILYSMPSSYDGEIKSHTAQPMIEMLKSIGVRNGLLFAQCIMHEGKACVYDIGFRLTGSMEYKLQEVLYGINPLRMLINHSLYNDMLHEMNSELRLKDSHSKIGFNMTFLGKEGTIKRISGAEAIRAIPQVIDVTFKATEGFEITSNMIGTLNQIISRIFFVADNMSEAIEIIDQINSLLYITDEDENDIIVDRFDTKRLIEDYQRNDN